MAVPWLDWLLCWLAEAVQDRADTTVLHPSGHQAQTSQPSVKPAQTHPAGADGPMLLVPQSLLTCMSLPFTPP